MFHGTYIGNNKMLIKTAWGMRLIASCDDMSLMPTLMVDGVIEGAFTNWLSINQERFAGKTILDVGANIGYFTVLFACIAKTGKVVAYEANPEVFQLLKENIYLSQLQDTVELNKSAVSDHTGYIDFHVSTKYQGNSSIIEHTKDYVKQFATDEFKKVQVYCDFIDHRFINVAVELLKIDTEGAEFKVLLGARKSITKRNIKYIMFELNKNMLGEDADKLYVLLTEFKKYGALFYLLNPDGTERHTRLEEIWQQNYIDNILMKF